MIKTIWLRKEVRPGESRTPLTPKGVKKLVKMGYEVVVESCFERAFDDSDYLNAGAIIEYEKNWAQAPQDALILGLKEIAQGKAPITHSHAYFAHAYKDQFGATDLLKRFAKGQGKLFDFEYLQNAHQERVAAFGHWAGYVGAGLAAETWCMTQFGEDYDFSLELTPYENKKEFLTSVVKKIQALGVRPRCVVVGAFGRSGKGAIEMLKKLDVEITAWGRQETENLRQRKILAREILAHDMLINCVNVKSEVGAFLTLEDLSKRKMLTTIADVSCDPKSPFNPLPLYSEPTSMNAPVKRLTESVALLAIDNLPALLPKESSLDFEAQVMPYLLQFLEVKEEAPAWRNSIDMFYQSLQRYGIALT